MSISHAPDSTGNAIADLSDAGIIGSNDACGFVGYDNRYDITEIDVFPTISLSGVRSHTVERRTRPRTRPQPVRVLTYGTFDLFHIGHLRLLERLRGLGDHLTAHGIPIPDQLWISLKRLDSRRMGSPSCSRRWVSCIDSN